MKNTLTLGTFLLGCCLASVAQMPGTQNQTPPGSTPSTFPQDQTGQSRSNPANPADPSTMPPDTSAPGARTGDRATDPATDRATQASSSQMTTVQGCLSQSSEGNFILADNTGSSFQLRGDTSQLKGYIGNEVKVDGMAMSNSGSNAGSMSSPASSGSSSGTATQFSVSNVHKLADACAHGSTKDK